MSKFIDEVLVPITAGVVLAAALATCANLPKETGDSNGMTIVRHTVAPQVATETPAEVPPCK